jgi:hypothetical protein
MEWHITERFGLMQRSYRGVSIDRVAGSGYYRAMPDCDSGHGCHYVTVMAETVHDIRRAIADVMNHGCAHAGW